ncbi:MAG TPA: LuxR C-terminal-related transcriptional regulator [Candidatus Saccharimonadales bacterium]|nr:LuxR C-terminal-related transcriptional regulator [Candidatus Saccharimonadales bacterium]
MGIVLTTLQLQILSAKAKGETSAEIARKLLGKNSARPVDNRLKTIFRRLKVDNIEDAIKATIHELGPPKERLDGITEDQMRIVRYVALEGLSSTQIAFRMFFSVSNVGYHIEQIYAKSGCRSRAHLIAVYLKHHAN